MATTQDDMFAELQRANSRLRLERDAALARRDSEYNELIAHQSATIDVLRVMSASPGDPQPVFDLIAHRARDLCDAYGVTVYEFDGTLIRWRASTGVSDDPSVRQAVEAMYPMAPSREWGVGRAIMDRRIYRIDDLETEPGLNPALRAITAKSQVALPLMRGEMPIGALALGSRERGGFSDSQVALLQTFAEQAVIAIGSAETYRALQTRTADLQESLEYQTAASDVLKVISRSTFDLQPVLDTLVETAARLCNADMANLVRREGELYRVVADFGYTPEYGTWLRAVGPYRPEGRSVGSRSAREGRVVHVHDIAADPNYPTGPITLGKQRTSLGVPLLREGEVIGFIVLARQRVEPFTDRQIGLVSTFAAQAVIAIENTRLLTEQQEALEQQTAMAEVLQVINASPGDLAPVFDTILEKARRLCEADVGTFWTFDGERFFPSVASRAHPLSNVVAMPAGLRPGRSISLGRIMAGEDVVHIVDVTVDAEYQTDVEARSRTDAAGTRSVLAIALPSERGLLGAITTGRRTVRPYSNKHIALLQNFAAQAVIAMENARLITEQREALEQQTATAEVLQVINGSPGNLAPVFDAMLEKAMRLCEAAFGFLAMYDGEQFKPAALRGVPDALTDYFRTGMDRPRPGDAHWRLLAGEDLVHNLDQMDEDAYRTGSPLRRAIVDLGGARSALVVALRKDGVLLGALTIYRKQVSPFSDKQIALLQNFAAQAVIAMENARLISEQREALEQQTATAEVLQVINASPGNLAPVFDAVLERALRLCAASFGTLLTYDGERVERVALLGVPPAFAEWSRGNPLTKNAALLSRGIATGEPVQATDVTTDEFLATSPDVRDALVELGGVRALLQVPLLKDGAVVGFIAIFRREPGVFPDKQIALLEGFAAQAVIAMENARLLTEQQEALEQQTATAEVLQVINASPGNLTPVFDSMLEKAMRLCGAAFGSLYTYDGEKFHSAAQRGVPPAYSELRERTPPSGRSGGPGTRILQTKRTVHILDMMSDEAYQSGRAGIRALVELGGARTILGVPLLKDDVVVGYISIYRQEVRAFSGKEIALLENFATQAVIAMENARLISEQREALEQQTATAQVLGVINASPGDLTPVFEAILEKAHTLCGATFGALLIREGEALRVVAAHGEAHFVDAYRPLGPLPPPAGSAVARLVAGEIGIVHVADVLADDSYRNLPAAIQQLYEIGGIRTFLMVSLRKDAGVLGTITAFRREVRPFTEKQIALLQNFAAQAVIAVENARLISEQREALEQQTATAEVLQVINASPGNLLPVFDAVLEKAIRLCESEFGIFNSYDGECFHAVATQGVSHRLAEYLRAPIRTGPGLALHRIAQGENVVHIADITDDDAYRSGDPGRRAVADLGGARSQLMVALRKDGNLLGAINIFRQQVRPFSDRQIALVRNFAEQAVIAMENARLLTEQREALEQQTATSDVLQVINSSLGDLAPVFDAILEKAHRLCGVTHGGLVLRDGETFRAVATHSYSGAFEEQLRQGYRGADNPITRSLIDGARFVHLPDLAQIEHPMVRASFELEGVRTGLYVPLRKDDVLLGMISSTRTEVRPFSDKEIALVENFAAQAVIAMENARLLGELQQRTGDLQESLEYQTAISDVLKVISRSTFDLQPVLETLLGTAARLCDADGGGISLREGDGYRMAASYYSATSDYDAFFRNRLMTVDRGSVTGRTVLEARIIHVTDIMSDPEFTLPAVLFGGARTVLGVPLLRDGVVVGVMILLRKPVLPFTDRQIELVATFADQAVIAIENVRLVTEQQDALEQQTATAEVLGVINASPGNLVPVFDAMLEKATRLCEADFGILWDFDEDLAKAGALHRVPAAYAEMVRTPFRPSPESGPARMMRGEGTFVVADLLELPAYHTGDALVRAIVDLAGARSVVITPLRKDSVTLGAITIYRQEVRPFTEKQVALLQNFAAQAVIAMENARLIDEIRAARDNAEATLRELKTAQANLIQAEKMASLGQLTAGIAHEIKNPLNFINNFSDLSVELLGELREAAAPGFAVLDADRRAEVDEVVGTLTSNLEKITEHGRRADGIVRGMLEHSRGVSGERRTVEINTLVDETLNLAYHGARAQDQSFNITLERDFAAGIPPVEANPQDLTRVFLNIFSNGFYAATERARNRVDAGFAPTLNVTTRDAGEAVEIRVRDNGIGIPADIRDKLFQPFFTTKPTGEGTGLGLSITYDIVTQQHGGSIAVDSMVGEYSEFTIRLPRNP